MNKIILFVASIFAAIAPAYAQDANDEIVVAVFDTGIAEVGALEGRVIANHDLYKVDSPRANLQSSHGTMVANIIAENTADNVKFIGMRVDRNRCYGDLCEVDEKALQRALRLAIDLDVDIIQASLSGKMRSETRDLFVEAANKGIAIVLAAGNKGGVALAGGILKEAEGNVYVVASLDAEGRRSEFSSRMNGSLRDQMIWRLGEDVPTIDRTGNATSATGTSFAAPLFASELIVRR